MENTVKLSGSVAQKPYGYARITFEILGPSCHWASEIKIVFDFVYNLEDVSIEIGVHLQDPWDSDNSLCRGQTMREEMIDWTYNYNWWPSSENV